MQLRSALLAATVLATPIAASAQPVTGLYVGLGAGINATQQENINGVTLGIPATVLGGTLNTNGNLNGSIGFAAVGSVGWGFGNGLRAEDCLVSEASFRALARRTSAARVEGLALRT